MLLVICLGIAAVAQAGEPIVVCLGDSITKGVHLPEDQSYPAVLGTLLPGVRVVNAGIGGNTSTQGLARLQSDALDYKPAAVVLLFGTNDSVLTGPGKYRTPIEQYRQNLRTMIDRCREHGAKVVIQTLPAINPEPYFTRHPRSYYEAEGGLDDIVARYRTAAIEVGRAMDVPVVDLYDMFAKDRTLLRPAPDGVHPTAEGCRAIAEGVAVKLPAGLPGT